MGTVKEQNLGYWTQQVPGLDATEEGNITRSFFENADKFRYVNEPYIEGFIAPMAKRGGSLLEVGFGLGTDLRYFARHGLDVWGLDFSPENARKARMGFDLLGLQGHITSGDAETLPFPDNAFDQVYSWGCLHHTPQTEKAIRELHRVLKPGGHVLVLLYHKGYQHLYLRATYLLKFKWAYKSFQQHINDDYDHTPLSKLYSVAELRSMFKSFQNVETTVVTFGGIQFHPVLKHLWRFFQKHPALLARWGSFAVTQGTKAQDAAPCNEPRWCCPKCKSSLVDQQASLKCSAPSCGASFPVYGNRIPVLHPEPMDLRALRS